MAFPRWPKRDDKQGSRKAPAAVVDRLVDGVRGALSVHERSWLHEGLRSHHDLQAKLGYPAKLRGSLRGRGRHDRAIAASRTMSPTEPSPGIFHLQSLRSQWAQSISSGARSVSRHRLLWRVHAEQKSRS